MKLFNTFAALLAASIATGAAAQDTVRMGTEGYYPPFNFFDAAGQVQGFDIDIGNALCAEMNVTCEWVTTDWDGIIPALNANKFDTILASMSITAERAEVVSFTNPYYFNAARFIAAEDSGITGGLPADLAGKVIGTQESTLEVEVLQQYFPDSEIRLYPKLDDALLDLESGRVDAAYASHFVLGAWLAGDDGEGFHFIGEASRSDGNMGTGIAVRQADSELRESINTALAAIIANGTYDDIRSKYFDFDIMTTPKTATELFGN